MQTFDVYVAMNTEGPRIKYIQEYRCVIRDGF